MITRLIHLPFHAWAWGLDKATQYLCGKPFSGGHQFNAELVASDDFTTYTIDPMIKCEHCGKPLPDKIYNLFVEQIQLASGDPEAELW